MPRKTTTAPSSHKMTTDPYLWLEDVEGKRALAESDSFRTWMAEYGNPDDPKEWRFIHTFSPYQNLKTGVEVSAGPLHHLHA